MYRCAMPARPGSQKTSRTAKTLASRTLHAAAASIAVLTASLGSLSLAALPLSAHAQTQPGQRFFPANALRGELTVGIAPDATLNGRDVRLAPGARIKDANDLVIVSASISGQKLTVHYTKDINGLLMNIWILNDVELANTPWPRTEKEASIWTFDAATQKWTKHWF